MNWQKTAGVTELLAWRRWLRQLQGLPGNPVAQAFLTLRRRRSERRRRRSRQLLILAGLAALAGGQLLSRYFDSLNAQPQAGALELSLQGMSMALVLFFGAGFVLAVYEFAQDCLGSLSPDGARQGLICIDELLMLCPLRPRALVLAVLRCNVPPLLLRFGLLMASIALSGLLDGLLHPWRAWETGAQMLYYSSSLQMSSQAPPYYENYPLVAMQEIIQPGLDGFSLQERLALLPLLVPAWLLSLLRGLVLLLPATLWALLGAVCSGLAYISLSRGAAAARLGPLAGASAALAYVAAMSPLELLPIGAGLSTLLNLALSALLLPLGLLVCWMASLFTLRRAEDSAGLSSFLATAGPLIWLGTMLVLLAFAWLLPAGYVLLAALADMPIALGRCFQLWQPDAAMLLSPQPFMAEQPWAYYSGLTLSFSMRCLLQLMLLPLLLSFALRAVKLRLCSAE